MKNLMIKGTSVFVISSWLKIINESIKNGTFYNQGSENQSVNAEIMAMLIILKDIFPNLLIDLCACQSTKEKKCSVTSCLCDDLEAVSNVIKPFLD